MLRKIIDWMKDYEPARLAGIRTAAIGLLATVGLTLSPALDAKIAAWVAGAAGVLTFIQSVLTRRTVYAPATVEQIVAKAGLTPQENYAPLPEGIDEPGPNPYSSGF